MKIILFLVIINCCVLQISIAQDDAQLYQKYLNLGNDFYGRKDYLTALDRFDLASGFAQTEAQKKEVNDKLNKCREKIKAQKSEIDINLKNAIRLKEKADSSLKVVEIEKQNVIKQKDRGDSAINANILNFYAFNSKDFALKSRQFNSNMDNEALYAIYSYKMINYGNQEYGKYGKIEPDNTVKESLIQTYLNNFGIVVDSSAAYTVNNYKDNILQCSESNGYTKIRLSKVSIDEVTQKTQFIDYLEFLVPGNNLITNTAFVSDNQFAIATSKGEIFINEDDKLEKIYNCGVRINDLKFDEGSNSLIFATIDQKIIKYNIGLSIDSIVQLPDSAYNLNIINSSVIIYNSLHKLHIINNMDAKSDKIIFESPDNYITKTYYTKQKALLFAGIKNRIYIFDFQKSVDYTAYSTEILNAEHKGNINFLYFDKQTNKLISSDWTGKIMTWDFSDSTENRIYTQPMVLETTKKNYAFSFNEILNSLFFADQKTTGCIPFNMDLLYKALVKKHDNPKMSQKDWDNNIKGDIKIPEGNNDN